MPHDNSKNPQDADGLRPRVTELETLLMHMQHEFQQLNEVILDQQDRFVTIERQILRIEQQVRAIADAPTEAVDPLDEKPPHY